MGSNVGFYARSIKPIIHQAFKTQAHIDSGVVLAAGSGVHIAPVSHRKQVDSNRSDIGSRAESKFQHDH